MSIRDAQGHLHSTMYLLNQELYNKAVENDLEFTFHYVSIKSKTQKSEKERYSFIYIPLCIY